LHWPMPSRRWLKAQDTREKRIAHCCPLVGQVSSAHSPFPIVVVVSARSGGPALLGISPPVADRSLFRAALRPTGAVGLSASRRIGSVAPIRPLADSGLLGRLAGGLGGNVHPYVLGLAVAGPSDFGPGVARACEPEPDWPASPAGKGFRPLVNLNTGYQPYSLPQRWVIIETLVYQACRAAMATTRRGLRLRLPSALRPTAQVQNLSHRRLRRSVRLRQTLQCNRRDCLGDLRSE